MSNIEYLKKQIEAKVEELREDIKGKPISLTTAYLQGKIDAYNFVLVALRENEEVNGTT